MRGFRIETRHGSWVKECTWLDLNINGVERSQKDLRYILVEGL